MHIKVGGVIIQHVGKDCVLLLHDSAQISVYMYRVRNKKIYSIYRSTCSCPLNSIYMCNSYVLRMFNMHMYMYLAPTTYFIRNSIKHNYVEETLYVNTNN